MTRKMAGRLVALVGLTAGACGLGAASTGCKKEGAASAASERAGRGMRGDGGLVFAVDTFEVEAKKVDYIVTAPGTLEAFERVQVTARVAGVVDRVGFGEGQAVKKGDVLVVIDSERYRLGVNSARAALEKTLAAQKDTEAMLARREGASEKNPGLIPGEELATYRTKTLTAKADTSVASEAVKVAELNLRDSAVRAPIEGVIQTRTVETGQYVQPGYVMATLLRADPMLLRFQVEPQEAARIKAGMKATFTLRETQRSYGATITLVSAAADATTHMVGVTGEVVDEGHKYWLRPGSFCDVSLDVGATRDAPLVPRTATRPTDHGYIVYAIENGAAVERSVKLGMSSKDGWVEVRSGISAGEQIVVRGAEALTTGARVRANKLTSFDPLAGIPVKDEPPAGEGRERDAGAGEGAPADGAPRGGRGRRDGGVR
jgi:RND family efflux transporter MFP subunit